jgi:hypothetical protein
MATLVRILGGMTTNGPVTMELTATSSLTENIDIIHITKRETLIIHHDIDNSNNNIIKSLVR